MRQPSHRQAGRRREGHDHSDVIAMCLWDGPGTLSEIAEQFMAFLRRFGFFLEPHAREPAHGDDLAQDLVQDLERMTEAGWVVRQGGC